MFQNINKKLESDEFHPQITIIKPSVADTIKLIVKLNKDEKRRIQKWSKEFDLEENVPNPFHITLGYLYRNIPKEIRIAILAQVQKITKDAIGGYHQLEFPKLTFFKDMLEFVSWDGQTNPF
jgi:hypothetical protein